MRAGLAAVVCCLSGLVIESGVAGRECLPVGNGSTEKNQPLKILLEKKRAKEKDLLSPLFLPANLYIYIFVSCS